MKQKYLLLTIILFMCLFLFSTPSLALIPGDFGSAGGGPPDGCVDFEDLMIFAMAYGSTPADANWNPLCDIAGQGSTTPDGVVDFEDLMIFAMHYGECSPPTYTVTYNGNGSTGGTVPSDANNYEQGDSVTVLGNTGNLVKTQDGISLLFTGWNTAADGSGTSYNEADTFNMGNANVTLFAQWSVLRGTGPAGGLIFYDKECVSDGWRYLEAAPSDQIGPYHAWSNIINVEIGTYAQGTAIGTGQVNTTAIIGQTGHTASAAKLCDDLIVGSYDDWFLSSIEELNLMYTNLHYIGTPVGGFAASSYWSSSEFGACDAWSQRFDNGHPTNDSKSLNTKRVRAVRAFRSTAPTYIVNYNANEATGGTVPSDAYHYEPGETVSVLDNTGSLVKDGYTFDGWNTEADGSGTDQAVGSTFTMGSANVTLYAKWTINSYTVTFNKNDDAVTGTMAAQTIASGSSANLTPCTFTKTGWTFAGWAETSGGAVVYVDGASYTMGTSNVTLYAKWTPPAIYSLRDIGPAGGYIFYDDEADGVDNIVGARYLEAAPSDQDAGDGAEWGCHETLITGADGILVGTGEQNTIDIENGCTTADTAADICANLSLGGETDWFLPSIEELNLMYENLKLSGVGGFADYFYWSSSQYDDSNAWNQDFYIYYQGYYYKNTDLRVRAVRAF